MSKENMLTFIRRDLMYLEAVADIYENNKMLAKISNIRKSLNEFEKENNETRIPDAGE